MGENQNLSLYDNPMTLYEDFRNCPKEALRPIVGGRLKGKSDINPMWRIKKLTERFGPCGIGWKTEIAKAEVITAGPEAMANVVVNLFFMTPDGSWSEPVVGFGGSILYGKGQGDGINDEAFKMAETDAISVCCKKLGMAADVYWGADADFGTKYEERVNPQRKATSQRQQAQQTQQAQQAQPAQQPRKKGYVSRDMIMAGQCQNLIDWWAKVDTNNLTAWEQARQALLEANDFEGGALEYLEDEACMASRQIQH